jgi:branched-chain amino acid transport system permease protein
MEGLISFLLSIATIIAIYSILTLALNIRWGFTGLLDFGIAGFFAIGAYTSAILTSPHSEELVFGVRHSLGFGVPFIGGLLAAAAAAAIVAYLIGIPTLRLRGDYLAIMTIGLSEIIRYVAVNEKWLTRGSQGIRNLPRPFSGYSNLLDSLFYFVLVLGVLLILYVISQRIYNSPLGRVLKGIREDETVTEALGTKIFKFRMLAFVTGAAFAGVAGCLWAHYSGSIMPHEFVPDITFLIWVSLTIGGSGNNKGAILGTLVLIGVLQQGTRFLPTIEGYTYLIPGLRLVVIGLVLILCLRFRPQGLIPEKAVSVEKGL